MNANTTRFTQEFLLKHEGSPASFTVHLYHEHWFLNNAKLLYTNQCSSILEDIRAFRIPVDLLEILDDAKVPFYDGRLIVELLDYRAPNRVVKSHVESPELTRLLLHPNDETIWADVLLLNAKNGNKWTDRELLQIEANIIHRTAPPLCLDPDPNLSRIVNTIIRVTSPGIPASLKRKQSSDVEEDESERIKRVKMLQFMDPRASRPNPPPFSRFERYFGDAKKNFAPPTTVSSPPINGEIPEQESPPVDTPNTQAQTQPSRQQTPQQPSIAPIPTPTPQSLPLSQITIPRPPSQQQLEALRNRNTPVTPESGKNFANIRVAQAQRIAGANGRESASQSPATSMLPTPQRPPTALPPEDLKPVPQVAQQRPPSTMPQTQANSPASFHAPLPPHSFLQNLPIPRKRSNAANNLPTHPTQSQSQPQSQPQPPLSMAQPTQAQLTQAQQIRSKQQWVQFVKTDPQKAKEFLQRIAANSSNAMLAQNVPARSSPLASGSNIRRSSPAMQNQQGGQWNNSPRLMQQQRGSPLLSATPAHNVSPPSRSPMPGTPQQVPVNQQQVPRQATPQVHAQQQQQQQQQRQRPQPQPQPQRPQSQPQPQNQLQPQQPQPLQQQTTPQQLLPQQQPMPQPQNHQQQMQHMQMHQYQQMQHLQQLQQMGQHLQAPNYQAIAAQYLQPRPGMQNPQQAQMGINRTGTPSHVQPGMPHPGMQRPPIPQPTPHPQQQQQQQQQQPHPQALQQQHSANIMSNLPYHPMSSNYQHLQQMASYNNAAAWGAMMQAGRGMPLTQQQQQQLIMAQMQMAGRGMGAKPPQPRQ